MLAQLHVDFLLEEDAAALRILQHLAVCDELVLDDGDLLGDVLAGSDALSTRDLVLGGLDAGLVGFELLLLDRENVGFRGEPCGLELGKRGVHVGRECAI